MSKVPYHVFLRLMQITRCHVYLTYHFFVVDAGGNEFGALVLGSKTAPIADIIQHGDNSVLVDFFDTEALAQQVCDVLSNPGHYEAMRIAGRQTIIDRFDLRSVCLPAYSRLLSACC